MKKIIMFLVIFLLIFTGVYFSFNEDDINTKIVQYNGNNLRISVDGSVVSALPTSGNYYLVDYTCKSADTVINWDRTNYTLEVSNKNKKGGVSCYLDFQSNPKLADMKAGSYVDYTGNNGCSDSSCLGQNVNYVSDNDMGYCYSSKYKFIVNGWRIIYIKDGSAYLASAGATDCMCTDSSGNASTSSCSDYLSSTDLYKHFDNMDSIAEEYCNKDYIKGGVCDEETAWAMNANDFGIIVGNSLSSSSCYNKYSDRTCGYTNDLIDNGGDYWFATAYSSSSTSLFYWDPNYRFVYDLDSDGRFGVRPVLYLDSSVIVTGGSGTYEDPYKISNYSFRINDGAEYVNASGASSVLLTLIGEGVSTMCISTDSSVCTNYVDFATSYTLDWSSEADGEKTVYVYYKNSSGKIIASMNRSIILDTTS